MAGSDEQELKVLLDALQTGGLSYEEAKSRYQQLGDAIRDRYEREITALSVDVAQSSQIKVGAPSPLDAQLAFDAYHRFVEQILAAHGCGPNEFTWAGDGLLAIFEQPEPAVAAGRALLEGVSRFNARLKLAQHISIRIGVHTGRILPGESPGLGKIASPTFDLAG